MASLQYLVFGPRALLAAIGLLRHKPRPAGRSEDWCAGDVDVVIPALNEEANVVRCLASVLRQTIRPRRIVLVDDGSADRTVEAATTFCQCHGVELIAIQRRAPIGKTPTVKRQARELDSEVEFVLDADTVLESPDYIERCVEALHEAVGVASVCGTVLPLGRRDVARWADEERVRRFAAAGGICAGAGQRESRWRTAARGITNAYRDVLYLFLQRFVYAGEMALFGSITNPVGCAVAYRRVYLKRTFDEFEPRFGDHLTNSEDIFLGFALLDNGYRNVQLPHIYARTCEPEVQKLPRQVYLWSSAFLQSCFYFDSLVKSPVLALRAVCLHRVEWLRHLVYAGDGAALAVASAARGGPAITAVAAWPQIDRRRLVEPYRQEFGRHHTARYGRPAGWAVGAALVEKILFPVGLLMLALLQRWSWLALTIGLETMAMATILGMVAPRHRLATMLKALLVSPIRYALVCGELVGIGIFAVQLWFTNDRSWHK